MYLEHIGCRRLSEAEYADPDRRAERMRDAKQAVDVLNRLSKGPPSPHALAAATRELNRSAAATRKPRQPPPDGLKTAAQAAAKLNCSIKTLNSHIASSPPSDEAERVTAKQAAAILGVKSRKLQAMSQRGEIPGAAKLGRQWTYDLAKLRGFVEQREQACQNEKPRLGATGAAEFYGAKFRLKASASGGRLRQMIQQSQRRAAKRAKSGR
jgi:hypothetical protein